MTNDSHFRQEQVRIARYRDLEREVTDPLALCLLHIIVEELEADLENSHRRAQRAPAAHGLSECLSEYGNGR